MSARSDRVEEEEKPEVPEEPFPIPRLPKFEHSQNAIQPEYVPSSSPFDSKQIQLYYSLVNFQLSPYDPTPSPEVSLAVETITSSYDDTNNSSRDPNYNNYPDTKITREIMFRSLFLAAQNLLFEMSSTPSLTKLSYLHNDLFYATDVLRAYPHNDAVLSFGDMLLADTYDMYNSVISKIINDEYWTPGKTADELIDNLLTKELENVRKLSINTESILSRCIILRALELAPKESQATIKSFASRNKINFE